MFIDFPIIACLLEPPFLPPSYGQRQNVLGETEIGLLLVLGTLVIFLFADSFAILSAILFPFAVVVFSLRCSGQCIPVT